MSSSFHFDHVDWFTAGTVGPKGQRVFYLQAQAEGEIITLRLEKQQVGALADYLEQILSNLAPLPYVDAVEAHDLTEPVLEEWIIGALGVAYEEGSDQVVLVAEELEDEDGLDTATARFRMTRGQALAFIDCARDAVAAGRDPCPFCARPLQPGSSWCPCHN